MRNKKIITDSKTPTSDDNKKPVLKDNIEGLLPLDVILNEDVIKELSEKLSQTIQQEVKSCKQQAKSEEEFQILTNILKEYLKCYLVIGYSLDGRQIIMGESNNQQDYNSLIEHLRQTFIKYYK